MAAKVKASSIRTWTGSSWKTITTGKAANVPWYGTPGWLYTFNPSSERTFRYDFNGTTHGFIAYDILSGSKIGATSTYIYGQTGTGLSHSFRFGAPLMDARVPAGSYRLQMRCRITKQGSDPDSVPVELGWGPRQDKRWVIGSYNTKGWGTHTSPNFTESSTWAWQPSMYISGGSLYDTVTTHYLDVDWVALQTTSGAAVTYLINNQFHVSDGSKWYVL